MIAHIRYSYTRTPRIVWGWGDRAYALIVLQLGLAFLNIRGVLKNRTSENKN